MDTDFWVVLSTSGQFRVTEQTVVEIRAEVARHVGKPYQENVELMFKDLADSQCCIVLASYLGVLESTAEQRRWDRKMNEALDAEKRQDGWSD